MRPLQTLFALAMLAGMTGNSAFAQKKDPPPPPPLIGRWDLVVSRKDGKVPSWLEVTLSGRKTLVGRFVGAFGSARPIGEVSYDSGRFGFSIPVQFEDGDTDIRVEGDIANDTLSGTISGPYFGRSEFTGKRAPRLVRTKPPIWGKPVELFNGKNMDGWKARNPKDKNGWVVRDGLLSNDKPGNDLVTVGKYMDFKVHVEFRYPKGSNSGVYLRGRYEAQIEDNYGRQPDPHIIGCIYGFLQPRINAAKKPGEWQSYDLMIVGREVTISLNGHLVVFQQEIPGITGGAIDSEEGEPGPLLIQGDHGTVQYRKITITPAK
jgi:hypothetical protein